MPKDASENALAYLTIHFIKFTPLSLLFYQYFVAAKI
jgi:hypothetical protein